LRLDTDVNDSNKTFRDDKYTSNRFADTEQFTEGSSYRREVFINILENYIDYTEWNMNGIERLERVETLKSYFDLVPKVVLNVYSSFNYQIYDRREDNLISTVKLNCTGLDSPDAEKDGYVFFGSGNIGGNFRMDYRIEEDNVARRLFGIKFDNETLKYYIKDLLSGTPTLMKIKNETVNHMLLI
jgi:hypothetical protein